MTPAEHTSQRNRVRRSLLETHCDVYAPRDRTGGKPDAAIVAHGPGPSPARPATAMAVGSEDGHAGRVVDAPGDRRP
jgi:hypothetical protein